MIAQQQQSSSRASGVTITPRISKNTSWTRTRSSLSSPYPKSPVSELAHRLGPDEKRNPHGGFTRPVAVCFALNYVVGTGFLVLPYVFVKAGIVLSVIVVVLSSLVADMAKDFVFVSMARAEYVLERQAKEAATKQRQESVQSEKNTVRQAKVSLHSEETEEEEQLTAQTVPTDEEAVIGSSDDDSYAQENETTRLLNEMQELSDRTTDKKQLRRYQSVPSEQESALMKADIAETNAGSIAVGMVNASILPIKGSPSEHGNGSRKEQRLIVKDRTIELSSLSEIFLGHAGLLIYTLFLSVYMACMLWAYASVFSQAMATSLPIPHFSEHKNYTIYCIIFGLIVCPLSFIEVEDQIEIQITLTILRVARLVLMIVTAFFCPSYFGETSTTQSDVPLFCIRGLGVLVPIVIAANLMHEALPDLSHPVKKKKELGKTFQWAFICTGIIYSILGASVAICFGSKVEPSANINWGTFASPYGTNDRLYKSIGYFVVISPALDVISAYPLNSIALGNNLMDVRCGSAHNTEPTYFTRMLFRMIAAIPPILGALFVRDLGVITDYAGIAGLAVTFCITSAMYLGSSRKQLEIPPKTYYDSYATSRMCALFLFLFGIALVLAVTISLVT